MLKVGELAASTQLTVRTLHHYDAIGLLKPSGRSEAGYRLYTGQDMARLHAILALRQLGLGLADIAQVFAHQGTDLPRVLMQQIESLRQQMARSQTLLTRLELLQTQLVTGTSPPLDEWLGTLSRMNTYGRYFSPAELKQILLRQPLSATVWTRLFADVQAAMDEGTPPDAPKVQPLAQRWLALMFEWMDGDVDLINRWGEMYRTEPDAYSVKAPSPDMVRFVSIAIEHRKSAMLRHMSLDELKQIRPLSAEVWSALANDIAQLQERKQTLASPAARQVLQRWAKLALAQVGQDRTVLAKMLKAFQEEPLLQTTEGDQLTVRTFIFQAMKIQGDPFTGPLDPDAT